jgi:hypothetical protein
MVCCCVIAPDGLSGREKNAMTKMICATKIKGNPTMTIVRIEPTPPRVLAWDREPISLVLAGLLSDSYSI